MDLDKLNVLDLAHKSKNQNNENAKPPPPNPKKVFGWTMYGLPLIRDIKNKW